MIDAKYFESQLQDLISSIFPRLITSTILVTEGHEVDTETMVTQALKLSFLTTLSTEE
jgi:hypothetical protein